MDADASFAVLNAEDRPPFFQTLADAILQVRSINRIDAIQQARNHQFVLDTRLTRQQAETLKIILDNNGIPTHVVSMDCLIQLGPAKWLSNADCLDDAFVIQPVSAQPLLLAWDDIAMIAYGRVIGKTVQRETRDATVPETIRQIAMQQFIYPGVPTSSPAYRPLKHEDREITETHDCLDIFIGYIRDPSFAAHFRVFSNRFYYDYLGPRRQTSSTVNFRLFLNDIISRAGKLVATERTRRFVAGEIAGPAFKWFDKFDEYNQWSAALARM